MRSRDIVVALVACVGLLAGVVPSAGADTVPGSPVAAMPWEEVGSPNAGLATGRFSAVACASALDCWAVGNSLPGIETAAAIAHWTGDDWTMASVPGLPGLLTYMFGADCAAADECFAVGMASNMADFFAGRVAWPYLHAVVYRWDGSAWTVDEMTFGDEPATERAVLRSVSCAAPGDCWAVGSLFDDGAHTLLLHWDGATWTRADLPPALDDGTLQLGALSCPVSDFCMAVGPVLDRFVVPSPRAPQAAMWDGTTWSLAAAPVGHPTLDSAAVVHQAWINGLSCTSATDCWAVGDADTGLFVDGDDGSLGPSLPLVEHWDGSAWTASVLPAPIAGTAHHVDDVACSSVSDCWAVGHVDGDALVGGPAADALRRDYLLHYDGTAWLPGPALDDPLATAEGDLASVACPSADRCWAVGQVSPGGQVHELLQGFDGTLWSSSPAPAAAGVSGNYLHDVACPAADDCWAVGHAFYGQLGQTVVQHWDGSAWSLVDAPSAGDDRYTSLSSVACAARDDCWAVGSAGTWMFQDVQPVALHWDGTAWTLAPPIPIPVEQVTGTANAAGVGLYVVQDSFLRGVDCVAADDCWAVGSFTVAAGSPGNFLVGAQVYEKPLYLRWDGASWAPVAGPATRVAPLTEHTLMDIACASATDCTAVGSQFARLEYNFLAGADARTLIDHWDGVAWTEVASPSVGPHINQLFAVDCAGDDCWAVGLHYLDYPYSGTPRTAPLALHRADAASWAVATLPVGVTPLSGVACRTASDCWAVGSPPGLQAPTTTTAVHWDGLAWSQVASPSRTHGGQPTSNNLLAVDCAQDTGSHCWAVGQAVQGRETRSLMLRNLTPRGSCGEAPCPSALDRLASSCVPGVDGSASKDFDRDGTSALYAWRGTRVTLHDDGSVTTAAQPGWCWMGGDVDDDGQPRSPEAPPTPVAFPEAGACVFGSGGGALKDFDRDGTSAFYAWRGTQVATHDDGSAAASPRSGWCWVAGDLDDDGQQRAPAATAGAQTGQLGLLA